jgi:hypothetical protein
VACVVSVAEAVRDAAAREKAAVAAECPGWDIWANSPYIGPDTWSAMPEGAPAAVLTGMSRGEVRGMVRAYEKRLSAILAEQRARLAEQEARQGGVADAEAAVTRELIGALEKLKAARDG